MTEKGIMQSSQSYVPDEDASIDATTLEKDCSLITRNIEDFKGIAGLVVIDPHAA
jgi:predicted nucleic acid-binding protein